MGRPFLSCPDFSLSSFNSNDLTPTYNFKVKLVQTSLSAYHPSRSMEVGTIYEGEERSSRVRPLVLLDLLPPLCPDEDQTTLLDAIWEFLGVRPYPLCEGLKSLERQTCSPALRMEIPLADRLPSLCRRRRLGFPSTLCSVRVTTIDPTGNL